MSEPLLDPRVHIDTEDVVVRVELGLTAYLADPRFWAREGAQQALDLMLALPSADLLRYYTTSVMTEWGEVGPRMLRSLRDGLTSRALMLEWPRHHFFLRLADEPNCPSVGFSYTEIDPRRTTRAGVLELTLPQGHAPEDLQALAAGLADIGPLYSLVGGYVARWNVLHPKLAFNQFYVWAQRYLGLDIQDAEEMAPHAPLGLPGSNWLTYLGEPLTKPLELDVAALERAVRAAPSVESLPVRSGLLLRAGALPTMGDLNRFAHPQSYAEVARLLEPHFVKELPEFWGAFTDTQRTGAWLRRLVGAEDWSA
ncbi:DUF3396 domain-containing protein [Myxococcus sp. K38C18041901]|uniref:type VI immunity family protein n=1 Tax=Myxococcus guangdongensis TaxID=2906760 RepID=UPI0020A71CEE|nr:type VI immunity family protein [Myxococcus guangdongensis]MCP3065270.1 DUF3396 domain-containing protein [Myxococcus guangdongensis]